MAGLSAGLQQPAGGQRLRPQPLAASVAKRERRQIAEQDRPRLIDACLQQWRIYFLPARERPISYLETQQIRHSSPG